MPDRVCFNIGTTKRKEKPKRTCLKLGPAVKNFVNEILNGEDVELAKRLLDDAVVGERDALLVDLTVSALVDKLTDSLQVRLAVCDIRLDQTKHLLGSPGDLDENTIVDLEQTEELEDFAGFGRNLVDTRSRGKDIIPGSQKHNRLTHEYGQRRRPLPVPGRSSRQLYGQPASA